MTTTIKNVTKELGEITADELKALPEHHQILLRTYMAGDHTYEGLAADLNIPVGTVRSRLSRARNAVLKARSEGFTPTEVAPTDVNTALANGDCA